MKVRYGLIYKATNTKTGKFYIGKTLRSLRERKQQHKRKYTLNYYKNNKLYNAFKKYGFESFKWEVLIENIPEQDLDWHETWLIITFDSKINGYNSTLGGIEEKNLKTKFGRIPWNKGLTLEDPRVRNLIQKSQKTRKKRNYIPTPQNENITYEVLHDCIINKAMTRKETAEFIGTTERLVKKWKQIWSIKSPNDGRIKKGRRLSPNTEFKKRKKFTGNQYIEGIHNG